MAVDEQARHALHVRLDEVLGPDVTGTLMELLPPVGWADVATRHDVARGLDALGHRVDAQLADLRSEVETGLAEVRGELRTGLADVRTELRTGLADVRTELHSELGSLRTDMMANQRQVMFGLFGAIAANAGVVWAALAVAT
jgi:hypothetical protein